MMMARGGSVGSVAWQQASHPCDSACQADPPQPVSAAQFKRMQAADKRLEAQAAARERAAKAKAKAAAEARARAHESCGWADLSCDLHKAASAFDKARHTVAATADAAVRAASDAAGDVASDVIRPGWELVVRAARDEVTAIADAAEYGIHAVGTAVSYAAQAGSRVYHAATKLADAAGRVAVHLVKTAYHAVKKAATATVAFVKHHAAMITSIVVGIAVFAGCEAVTAGVGSIGCAALAGALSNMASRLVEVNRDRVVAWLPGVFSWRWRCVSAVVCRGCRRCGPACAGWPGCGTRMPGGLRDWRGRWDSLPARRASSTTGILVLTAIRSPGRCLLIRPLESQPE